MRENSSRQEIVENQLEKTTESTDIELSTDKMTRPTEKTPMDRDVNRQQCRCSNESHGTMHRK